MEKVKNPVRLITKHPLILAGCMIVSAAGAALYWYLTPPVYTSETAIQSPPVQNQNLQVSLINTGKTIATEEITSESFLKQVFTEKPELLVNYYIKTDYRVEQTFYRFPYEVKTDPTFSDAELHAEYIIRNINDEVFALTKTSDTHRKTIQGRYGDKITDSGLSFVVNKKPVNEIETQAFLQPTEYFFTIESPSYLAGAMTRDEKLLSAEEENGVITIEASVNHPDKANQLASAIANKFSGRNSNGNGGIEDRILELDQKIADISDEIAATEIQITEYKNENRITDVAMETRAGVEVMKDLQLQKTALELQMATLENLTNYLRKNREGNNSLIEIGTIEDPDFIALVRKLSDKYQQNPNANDAETEHLKNSISEKILNTRKKTAVQLEEINNAISRNQAVLSGVTEKSTALMALERKLQLDQKVFELLTEKRAEAIVNNNILPTGTQIIKPASIPANPSSPTWISLFLSALLSSLALSWLISSIVERRRISRVNTVTAGENITNIPFIGTITGEKTMALNFENTQNICSRILMMEGVKTITVTTGSGGEMAADTSSILAEALSSMDKKVLLVDMNLRTPFMEQKFQLTPANTLADVLQGHCSISNAITPAEQTNLEVLLPGNLLMGINTWLSSKKRQAIMEQLEERYDYIIFNTPPINKYIDALPFAKSSDLTLFAAPEQASRADSVEVAESLVTKDQVNNVMLVLKSKSKGKVVSIVKNQTDTEKDDTQEPKTLLRRIALWFY